MTQPNVARIRSYRRPGWWARFAACRGMDPEVFHPSKGRPLSAAKAVCVRCPVVITCREWALANNEKIGVWGATTPKERREIRRARRKRAA